MKKSGVIVIGIIGVVLGIIMVVLSNSSTAADFDGYGGERDVFSYTTTHIIANGQVMTSQAFQARSYRGYDETDIMFDSGDGNGSLFIYEVDPEDKGSMTPVMYNGRFKTEKHNELKFYFEDDEHEPIVFKYDKKRKAFLYEHEGDERYKRITEILTEDTEEE